MKNMPCAAHSLQLVVNQAISQTRSRPLSVEGITAKPLPVEDILAIFKNYDLGHLEDEVSVYNILKRCKRIVDFFTAVHYKTKI